jgi:hypothetical protein
VSEPTADEIHAQFERMLSVPYPYHKRIPVIWLMSAGLCSAPCLLAYGDDCSCACFGRYHGALQTESVAISDDDIAGWPRGRREHVEDAIYEQPGFGPEGTTYDRVLYPAREKMTP